MIKENKISDTMTGLVIFELAGYEFCADLKEVSAILNPRELNKSEKEIVSDLNIQVNDQRVPLINLHKLYGISRNIKRGNLRVMLVEMHEKIFGFIVERVKEILTMNKSIRNTMRFHPETHNYLLGKVDFEGRELLMPDFQKIIDENKN